MAQSAQYKFFITQIDHVEQEIVQVQYADIQYPMIVPVDTSAWEWTDRIVWYSGDGKGEPKRIANAADDLPIAEVSRDEHVRKVEMFALAFGYTLAEINVAMRTGTTLNTENVENVNRRMEEKLERITLTGEDGDGLDWNGLINSDTLSGLQREDAPQNAAGNSREWEDKSPTEILRDINAVLSGIWASSQQIEMADTILLPPKAFDFLSWTTLPNTDRALWDFIMRNNTYSRKTGQPLMIYSINELSDIASGAKGRMIAYRKAPDVLKLHLPMPFSLFDPRMVNSLKYMVDGIMRTGGLEIRRPGAVRYLDLIS